MDDFPNEDMITFTKVVTHSGDDGNTMSSVLERMAEADLKGCIVMGFDKDGHYFVDGNVGRFEGNFLADRFKEYMLNNG